MEIDRTTETWRALVERTEERLADCRAKNDGALDAEKTAHLRGRIAELKDLLALDNPIPALVADEPTGPFAY